LTFQLAEDGSTCLRQSEAPLLRNGETKMAKLLGTEMRKRNGYFVGAGIYGEEPIAGLVALRAETINEALAAAKARFPEADWFEIYPANLIAEFCRDHETGDWAQTEP
jgi:hypothetical protein